MSGHMDHRVGAGGAAAGAGAGGADGQPRPRTRPWLRPMVRKSGPSWTDEQFLKKRTCMRQRILRYLRRHHSKDCGEMPKLAEQLEEILHTEFPSKADYCTMMKPGVSERLLLFALKILKARNNNRQNPQNTTQMVANHDGLSEQSASIPPTQNNNADGRDRTAMGLLQRQPTEDMALSGANQQFVMLRTATREKIIEYTERIPLLAKWEKWVLAVQARRFEDILYTKFPNMNDYYNMMKGPIEPGLRFAIRTYKAQRQQSQQDPQMARETASSSGTITPDVNHDDLCEQFASLLSDVQNQNANEQVMTERLPHYGGSH